MINRKTIIRVTKKYTKHQNVVCSYEVGATPHTNTEEEATLDMECSFAGPFNFYIVSFFLNRLSLISRESNAIKIIVTITFFLVSISIY